MGPALGAEEPDVGVWCWPQELVQPEMLVRTPPTSARPSSSRRVADGVGQAADWVTARLHVSAPGQATTSRLSSAPGSAMPMASRRSYSVGSWASVRPRKTTFWRLVTRTSAPSSRWIEARARNWSEVMSPSRAQA